VIANEPVAEPVWSDQTALINIRCRSGVEVEALTISAIAALDNYVVNDCGGVRNDCELISADCAGYSIDRTMGRTVGARRW
jgi:hypothetical protein